MLLPLLLELLLLLLLLILLLLLLLVPQTACPAASAEATRHPPAPTAPLTSCC